MRATVQMKWEKRQENERIMRRRLVVASIGVSLLLAAIPVSALAEQVVAATVGERTGEIVQALSEGNLETSLGVTRQVVFPERLIREVYPFDCHETYLMAGLQSVCEVRIEEPAEVALADARAELAARGWQEVPSGSSKFVTFCKESGEYRWAKLSVSEQEGVSHLVFQLVNALERNNS